jgi:Cu(I)/Ag(I) efflux system protein CusF
MSGDRAGRKSLAPVAASFFNPQRKEMQMKQTATAALVIALMLGTSAAIAQQKMGDMPMKDMPMKDMPMGAAAQGQTHHATGTVKNVDAAKGTVTVDHGPVKSLEWPAMTMTFAVKDKTLFDKLTVGKKAEFEFSQDGKGYVVTSVK